MLSQESDSIHIVSNHNTFD